MFEQKLCPACDELIMDSNAPVCKGGECVLNDQLAADSRLQCLSSRRAELMN